MMPYTESVTLWQIIKKVPWLGWIGMIVVILLIWQSLSGFALSRKLYNMALDNLRTDQSRIVKILEESQKTYEKELVRLQNDLISIQKQKATIQAESDRLKGVVREKDAQILALKKERDAIVVPTDINDLANEFRKRGYNPTVIVPTR